ncbi:hypothetical protein GCM10018790_13990 [Kitasatospora xanthocidica]|uniref:transposase family protein n=1 Tax=Kitasatospora xanthocidica TaxID=83382 RepID=UPI001677E61C|nr:transposase family protein [Kitasatospora xanthocidica]GHF37537.1 hypothetical protein GCM10018790_13990 [Kitasatospora xanthocidica]
MSARSSSPIPAGLDQLAATRPAEPGEHPQLLGRLAAVPDPRRAEGRRHPLAFVLALAACAVPAGAKSLAAIAEWAADAPPAVLVAPGAVESAQEVTAGTRWSSPCALLVAASIERGSMMLS